MSASAVLLAAKATNEASAIGPALRLSAHDTSDPVAMRAAIFNHNPRPLHDSWSLSRTVMSRPIKKKAVTSVREGPKAAMSKLAATIAARYNATSATVLTS